MKQVFGNTEGLKTHQQRALRALYRRRVPPADFISPPMARTLTELSRDTGRRVGVLIDRTGTVDKVVVGEAHRLFLPDLGPRRAGAARFRGVRLVHTSLRPSGLTEEDLTDLALLQLDAVATIYVREDGLPGRVQVGHLLPPSPGDAAPWRVFDVPDVHGWKDDWAAFIADLESQFARSPQLQRIDGAQKVILVGLTLGDPQGARRGLTELERLAETAGLEVVDVVLQRRDRLDGRTFVGKGKLQELIVRSMHLGAEALIFDRELSPSQLRNIAQVTELSVLDRTQLILDIFAQRARSREGKLQVELAQLRYRMPRLAIMPTAMSRLTGGIGGRGPGETKLEINRRRAQDRLVRLERQLQKLAQHRATRRKRRERSGIPIASIVGYTNAGKSTLLNRLTRSEVDAEDKLFATLDPTSRRFRFPEEREILITDTVGFIHDLPDTLVQAFRATLEELEQADLLLHVLDASDGEVEHHLASVHTVLTDLSLQERQTVLIWNKADAAQPQALHELMQRHGGLATSAVTGEGLDALLEKIERTLFRERLRQLRDTDRGMPSPPHVSSPSEEEP
ncbi:MAG: GTPase HflX [Deltaproteobacteria bacterium]|nr:MAG: GTPase HflX [Deltaproteobacteria bacterium]